MKIHFKVILLFILAMSLTANANAAENWDFLIEGYISFSSIEGNAGVGRITGVDVNVDFDDILENLELGAMVHFEAFHESDWGLIFDYGFMKLGADTTIGSGGVVDVGVRQGVLQANLTRRLNINENVLDFFVGFRWWDNDLDTQIDPAILPGTIATEIDQNWVDPVIGARWLQPLNDKWTFQVMGDIGGAIESDFTAALATGFQYRWNERWAADIQYKAIWVDYADGTPGTPGFFAYDTVTHGPLLGIIYNF